jgi:hypothetical protein
VSGASAGRSRPRPFKLYEPRQRAYAWIGWLLVAACCAGMIIGIVGQVVWRRVDSGYEPLAWFSGFGLFFSLLGTVNSTRPVLAVGKRGVRVRDGLAWQLIPWGEVGDVRLVRNGDYRVVVSAYAGSMTAGCAIPGGTPEGTFASLAQRIREFEEWARTSPSAIGQLDYVARGSHRLREPIPGTALTQGQRHEDRAERRLAGGMLGGLGVNLDGAARLISGWAPDPTGRHEIRFIKNAQWTALVMSAGLAASDGSVTGPARFDWDGPNTAPATSRESGVADDRYLRPPIALEQR